MSFRVQAVRSIFMKFAAPSWRIPVSLLAGKECYLVMSPKAGGIYFEEPEPESQQR